MHFTIKEVLKKEGIKMDKILKSVIINKAFTKIIFSKSKDEKVIKTICRLYSNKNQTFVAFETFLKDGKTSQKNISIEESVEYIKELFPKKFAQLNVISPCGDAEIKESKKGKILVSNKIDLSKSVNVQQNLNHNKQKNYVINGDEKVDFLVALGVQDNTGKIYDKKQSKFRQINRFLEIVKDVEKEIIKGDDELYILDLCCGKSYLSFAIYYYFAILKNKKVIMDCVDLKQDVINYCKNVAEKLNYKGLNFICEDVLNFKVKKKPNLTVSLHACDIATDIVIEKGIKSNSGVILSTPCCHHEVFWQLKKQGSPLDILMEHSILKGKFTDSLTDSLRCKILEIAGYQTIAIELIDPEETPKNVLIRAVKTEVVDKEKTQKNILAVKSICETFKISPYLVNEFIK